MVTKYHKKYSEEIGLSGTVETYIQLGMFKKTIENISIDFSLSAEPESGMTSENYWKGQADACVEPAAN